MTANQDFLHDTAVRFDQYLLDRKIPHEFRSYGDSQHPRGHVFHVNQKDPEIAARCNADEIDFLRRLLISVKCFLKIGEEIANVEMKSSAQSLGRRFF